MRIKKIHAICIQILWVYIYKLDKILDSSQGGSPQTRGKRFLQETLMEKGGGPVPAMDAIRLHRLSIMCVHFQDPPGIIFANMFWLSRAKNSFCSMSIYSYSRNQERIWVRITGIEETYLLNIPSTKLWSLSVSQCVCCLNKFHGPWNVVVLFFDPQSHKISLSIFNYSNIKPGWFPPSNNQPPAKQGSQPAF